MDNPNISNKPKKVSAINKEKKYSKVRRKIKQNYKEETGHEFEDNDSWDHLQKYHTELVEYYNQILNLINRVKQENPLVNLFPQQREVFIKCMNLLKNDCIRFDKELKTIYNIHKDKHGGCQLEDISIVMEIGAKYANYLNFYTITIRPTYDQIIDLIHVAEANRKMIDEAEAKKNTDNEIN